MAAGAINILGRDFSGVVSEVGPGVTDFRIGDAVFGVTEQGFEGAYAEKIAVKAAIVAKKPPTLSHAEAAALGLVSLTALVAIEDTAHLKAGQTILIQGGAGGVAGFAIALAKHIGATVITTASAGNLDYVRSLGADKAIDYNKEDFIAIGPVCDVVFDTVGGNVRSGCYKVLKPSGKLVWVAPAPEGFEIPRKDVQTRRPDVKRDRAHLERMLELVALGAVRPPHHHTLQARRRGRGASHQRKPPPARQAGAGGALTILPVVSSRTRRRMRRRIRGSRW